MKRTITMPVILKITGIFMLAIMLSCTGRVKAPIVEAEAEQTVEWISLFDGETLDGWKRYNANEIGPLWTVEDGTIKCDGVEYS